MLKQKFSLPKNKAQLNKDYGHKFEYQEVMRLWFNKDNLKGYIELGYNNPHKKLGIASQVKEAIKNNHKLSNLENGTELEKLNDDLFNLTLVDENNNKHKLEKLNVDEIYELTDQFQNF